MTKLFPISMAITLTVISSSRSEAAGPDDLARQMADGNRAAISAVRTLTCRFSHEVVSEAEPGVSGGRWIHLVSGQYWRTPDRRRILTPHAQGFVRDRMIRNGKCWVLNTYSGPNGGRSLLSVEPDLFTPDGDVWEYALFQHWLGGDPPQITSYAAILAKATRVRSAGRVTEGGREMVHVQLDASGDEYDFWFDPAVNYLIRKFAHRPTSAPKYKGNRRVDEVTQFVEPVRGVFFPTVIEHKPTRNGGLDTVIRTTLADVKVNQDIPITTLRLPNIAGMVCGDQMRNTDYTVDADGNRIGPEAPTKVTVGSPGPVIEGSPPDAAAA